MKSAISVYFLIISFLLSLPAIADQSTLSKASELKQLDRQIAKLNEDIKKDSGHRVVLASELEKNKSELKRLQNRFAVLKEELGKKQITLNTLKKNHSSYQKQLMEEKALTRQALQLAYVLRYTDQSDKWLFYCNYLNDMHVDRIDGTSKVLGQLENKQKNMLKQKTALQKTLTQQQKTQQQLTTVQQEQQRHLRDLSTQLQSKNARLHQLIADRKALTQLLIQLERARKAREARERKARERRQAVSRSRWESEDVALPMGATFTQLKGRLPWPATGNVGIHFGSPIEQSELRHNGVLLTAPLGSAVHAIYPGRVVFANSLRGLGLLTIVDHGHGYLSLYGHNQALYKKVGSLVKAGDIIATVGNTDTTAQPGVYFEIRYNSRPLNPERWCR